MNPFDRIELLDGQGWIELQDVMPDPDADRRRGGDDPYLLDRAVVQAARTSHLGESKGDEADKRLLFRLMRDHHDTPFEMVEFKFRVHAPVVVFWQWSRHRSASYNASSGRYTEFKDDDFYIPGANRWRLQSGHNKQASDGHLDSDNGEFFTKKLQELQDDGFRVYKLALEDGIAKEQARFFLPAWCSMYTWIVKVDARNLMSFLRLRMADDAQYEIRVYAGAIYQYIFEPLMPWTAEAFGKFVLNPGAEDAE